jgi:hypothetical protein
MMRGVGFGGNEQDIVISKEVNNAAQRQAEMDKIGLISFIKTPYSISLLF